ncbi:MAG TPA: NAD(P)/FAD-dependent oxidoreductase [Chitinophagaceae bacterium]|nr:NAD(P)/FAD-dependent oxidoreductase [Chitinophagaceae bacterium]
MSKHLIVIGGGAAGFFCAVNAVRLNPALKITILEKSNKLLSKVKISGGGRCNVTHACFDITEMSKQYPRGSNFVKKTFHQFFTGDTIKWFEEREVKLKTEPDGRMFPVTDSSQTIIDCLMREANRFGVEIKMRAEVRSLKYEGEKFEVELSDLRLMTSDFVCIACGGYSKPSMFDWLKNLGHSIEDPVPSLFTFNLPGHPITKLMGVGVENAKVKIQNAIAIGSKLNEEGPLLITHWGLSGPVILRLSAWGARQLAISNLSAGRQGWQFVILINWLPLFTEQTLSDKFQSLRFEMASQKMKNRNPFGLPQRLWEFLVDQSGIRAETRWADLAAKDQNRLIKNLCGYELEVKGKTTFKEEFVTAGGIRLNEVDPNTMQSKLVPNLFFAGEILDVDGITGGYNFQHAWTSGFIAAKSIAHLSS